MVLQEIYDAYHYFVEAKADLRTKDWFLVSSPWPVISILVVYLFLGKILGQWLMKNREPLQLKYVLLVYNALEVTINLFIASHVRLYFTGNFSMLCIPLDYSDHPVALTIANATYWFYINKYIELLDTVFLVLKKKKISYFHVTYHASAVFALFIGSRYLSSGNGLVFGFLNSTTHVVMYSYYFIAALGPRYQKLWLRRHVTHVQILHMLLVILQAIYGLSTGCKYPKLLDLTTILVISFFLSQTLLFYYKKYIAKKKVVEVTNKGIEEEL